MTTAEEVKRHIDQATENRDALLAILIAEQISHLERGKRLQPSGNAPTHSYSLRVIEYLEQRLREARKRERWRKP
jgi:hypothetical protein